MAGENKQQARSTQRQSQLLTAAIHLLLSGGISAVTHRGVAKASGSSPGSVRYYFRTSEDLLSACLDEIENKRAHEAEAILTRIRRDGHPTREQTALLMIKTYFGANVGDAMITGLMWSVVDCARGNPRLAAQLAEHRQASKEDLGLLLSASGYPELNEDLMATVLDGSALNATLHANISVLGTVLDTVLTLLSKE